MSYLGGSNTTVAGSWNGTMERTPGPIRGTIQGLVGLKPPGQWASQTRMVPIVKVAVVFFTCDVGPKWDGSNLFFMT